MAEARVRHVGIVDVEFGASVTVVEPVNLYGCRIGDGCFIGPFVEIQRDVSIGARSRIQSHSFVCELVTIGMDCVVAHGVMFINDLYRTGGPARGETLRRSDFAEMAIHHLQFSRPSANVMAAALSAVDGWLEGAFRCTSIDERMSRGVVFEDLELDRWLLARGEPTHHGAPHACRLAGI